MIFGGEDTGARKVASPILRVAFLFSVLVELSINCSTVRVPLSPRSINSSMVEGRMVSGTSARVCRFIISSSFRRPYDSTPE
jgi:hypothetical protein